MARIARLLYRIRLVIVVGGLAFAVFVQYSRGDALAPPPERRDVRGDMVQVATYSKTLEGDRVALRKMIERGDDLSRATDVYFYLYVPTQRSADRVARDVRALGYACEVRIPLGRLADGSRSDDWLVYAGTRHIVSVAYLQSVEATFTAEVRRVGGNYDGWEAKEPGDPTDPRPTGS